jgi:hypothetical protein
MQSMDVFIQCVTEPISLLSQGLTGLILFLGAHAFWIWLIYQVIIRLPDAVAALMEVFSQELNKLQYMSGTKYRVFLALMKSSLVIVVLATTYMAMRFFLNFFLGFEFYTSSTIPIKNKMYRYSALGITEALKRKSESAMVDTGS